MTNTSIAERWGDIEVQIRPEPNSRYDIGLKKVVDSGFERYLRVHEATAITIALAEGARSTSLQAMITEDHVEKHVPYSLGRGYEWLSLAWEIHDRVLTAYIDPVGLKFQEWTDPETRCRRLGYRTPAFSYRGKEEFSLEGLPRRAQWAGLRYSLLDFDDDFSVFHFGRTFEHLPAAMRESDDVSGGGGGCVRIDLPPDDFLIPVAYFPTSFLLGHIGGNGVPRGARGINLLPKNHRNT